MTPDVIKEFKEHGLTFSTAGWEDYNPQTGWHISNGDYVRNNDELLMYLEELKNKC